MAQPVLLKEEPGNWQDMALCSEIGDLDLFYPEKGNPTQRAKSICARCEVKDECLTWAIETREYWGVWGGLGEQERRKLFPKRRP